MSAASGGWLPQSLLGAISNTQWHLACVNYCLTQDSPVCDMRLKPVCFFFFCRSSHRRRTHPVCLTRLPFLSFQHYIWPPWMRCIIIYIRYRMSLNRLSLKSSLNLRLCVIIIMEVEANVRLTVHFWKCNFGMLWISPALQKRVFPKAASLSDFSGMILVWAAVWGETFSLAPSPPCWSLLSVSD